VLNRKETAEDMGSETHSDLYRDWAVLNGMQPPYREQKGKASDHPTGYGF